MEARVGAFDDRLVPVSSPADDDDLVEAYPWPDRTWVRALMVFSLEGAVAGPDGSSRSISGPADRAVLSACRRLADAVVIGAQTMRAEVYSPMRTTSERMAMREARGLAPAPRLVIVTASLDLPWEAPAFHESALPPLILASSSAPVARMALVPDTCELIVAPDREVEPAWILSQLVDRGLRHVLVEGGPRLLAQFAQSGDIDEWALTLSGIVGKARYAPVASRAEDEFLFTRFIRKGEST